MNPTLKKSLSICIALAITAGGTPAALAAVSDSSAKPLLPYSAQLSANVPLDSYVYDYIAKLDGLGYLKDMQTGTKPYTRMQIARWIVQIDSALTADQDATAYAKTMVAELKNDFKRELAVLHGSKSQNGLRLTEWNFTEDFYHGNTIDQKHTKSSYQPLNINNNGYRYGSGANEIFTFNVEGKLNDDLVMSLTPRLSYDNSQNGNISLESGYVKSHINNVAIQVGKDAASWGQGSRGTLLYSNNAMPQTAIKISNIEPKQTGGFLKFLGQRNTTLSYSVLETNRDIPSPSFFAAREDLTPNKDFTIAFAYASLVGGEGHMLSRGDYRDMLSGHNAGSAANDKWDSISGADFRWRIPKWNGIQLYGEYYGEDMFDFPLPSKVANIGGIYIPRLSKDGSWDAQLELHHTTDVWYNHSAYTDGWTYRNNIMGDAIGNDARSYYAKLTHYNNDGSALSFNFERLKMQINDPSPLKVDSLWLTYRTKIDTDLFLNMSAGYADISNVNYSASGSDHNYSLGIGITKHY